MEIRLPWALLNIKDPSQKEIFGDLWREGLAGSQTIEGLRISAVSADRRYLGFFSKDARWSATWKRFCLLFLGTVGRARLP